MSDFWSMHASGLESHAAVPTCRSFGIEGTGGRGRRGRVAVVMVAGVLTKAGEPVRGLPTRFPGSPMPT